MVAARDRDRATAFAAANGIERVAASYDAVVTDPEVDLVYNPLANSLHSAWNIRALQAGKHVLSEKPFSTNAADARLVAQVASTCPTTVMEAYHYAFHPVMRRVLEVVESGEIGTVIHVESTMKIPAPDDGNPRWSFELGGGAQMDLGCYSLHAMRMLGRFAGGEPTVTAADARERGGRSYVDEWMHTVVTYPSGATGHAIADMDATGLGEAGLEMTLTVIGTAGRVHAHNFVLPHMDDRVDVTTASGVRTENLGTRPTYDYQLDVMAAAIANGTPAPLDLVDAIATMDLVDASYLTAGLPVRPSAL